MARLQLLVSYRKSRVTTSILSLWKGESRASSNRWVSGSKLYILRRLLSQAFFWILDSLICHLFISIQTSGRASGTRLESGKALSVPNSTSTLTLFDELLGSSPTPWYFPGTEPNLSTIPFLSTHKASSLNSQVILVCNYIRRIRNSY